METEIWKPIPEYEGFYEASSLGNVRSIDRVVNNQKIKGVMLTKKYYKNDGYYKITLCKNGKREKMCLHQAIAMTFLGHTRCGINGLVVDHIDEDKTNNTLSNLQLLTARQNTSKSRKNKSSKYIGPNWEKRFQKWRVTVTHNKRRYKVGYFDDEKEAHIAYTKAVNNLKFGIMPNESIGKGRMLRRL
jgi:hypothetical protein